MTQQSDKQIDRFQSTKLRQGETIVKSLKAWDAAGKNSSMGGAFRGRLILTNQRVCFYKKIMLSEKLDSIDLTQLKSYETSNLMKAMNVKLMGYQNSIEVQAWAGDDVKTLFFQELDQRIAGNSSAPKSVKAPDLETPLEQIRKLATLHAEGLLTDSEFASKKSELLAKV